MTKRLTIMKRIRCCENEPLEINFTKIQETSAMTNKISKPAFAKGRMKMALRKLNLQIGSSFSISDFGFFNLINQNSVFFLSFLNQTFKTIEDFKKLENEGLCVQKSEPK